MDISEEMLRLAQEIAMKGSRRGCGNALRDYLEKRISECEREVERFRRKYGVLGVEDDYFEWDGAHKELEYLREKLGRLSE